MLHFDGAWRFDTPGPIATGACNAFEEMISKIVAQGNRKALLEHFKSHFAGAAGVPHYVSSDTSWAESDLQNLIQQSSNNAPLFIEACVALGIALGADVTTGWKIGQHLGQRQPAAPDGGVPAWRRPRLFWAGHDCASVPRGRQVRLAPASSVRAIGAVKPKIGAEVRVGSRLSGRLERLPANIGDRVEKGQVLAELESAAVSRRSREGTPGLLGRRSGRCVRSRSLMLRSKRRMLTVLVLEQAGIQWLHP
jgi:Biotin-lipoyl like